MRTIGLECHRAAVPAEAIILFNRLATFWTEHSRVLSLLIIVGFALKLRSWLFASLSFE